MKIVLYLSWFSLFAVASVVIAVVTDAGALACFGFAAGTLVLLLGAADYAPRPTLHVLAPVLGNERMPLAA